jgi:hypothetical protein
MNAEPASDAAHRNEPEGNGPESNGVDADRLPPSLNIAPVNDADEEAPKPRRRRTIRTPVAEAPAE